MRYFFLYALLSYVLRNPLLILLGLAIVYLVIDRGFIGLLPDFTRPFRRRRHMTRLAEEIRLNPANATGQLELGALYLERGQASRALPFLEKAHERMADSARALLVLGACYHRLGRESEAKEVLEQAIAINPKVGYGEPYYYLLAIALQVKTRDEAVLTELKERILSRGSTEVFYRTGRILLRSGDRAGARAMFQEAVDNYQASPKGFRRAHRRFAVASWIFLRFAGESAAV